MSTENPQEKDIFSSEKEQNGIDNNSLEQGGFESGKEKESFSANEQEVPHIPFEDDEHLRRAAENAEHPEQDQPETDPEALSNDISTVDQGSVQTARVTEENLEHAVVNLEVNPDNAAEIVDDLEKITALNKVLSGETKE